MPKGRKADVGLFGCAGKCRRLRYVVLSRGRSAHRNGWPMSGDKVISDIPEMVEPDLMYELFDQVDGSLDDLAKSHSH